MSLSDQNHRTIVKTVFSNSTLGNFSKICPKIMILSHTDILISNITTLYGTNECFMLTGRHVVVNFDVKDVHEFTKIS